MSLKNKKKDRLTYSIGQVAAHTELPQSVLRYWETVFTRLNPLKSPGGSRQYSDADIAIIQRIKELLYEKGFKIKGANLQLEKDAAPSDLEKAVTFSSDEIPSAGAATPVTDARVLSEQLKNIIKILEAE
jgi:DNA-binding transcriptional MerR regulator